MVMFRNSYVAIVPTTDVNVKAFGWGGLPG